MNLKFWKKKVEPQKEVVSEYPHPFLSLSVLPSGEISGDVYWPKNSDRVGIARSLASLIYLLNQGQLLDKIQQGVIDFAQEENDTEMAQTVLMLINDRLRLDIADEKRKRDVPVVPASKVFAMRGEL